GDRPLDVELTDSIRADRSFERSPEGPLDLFWIHDRHFGQAYGIDAEGHQVRSANARALVLRYQNGKGETAVRLEPGTSFRLARRVIPGADTFQVRTLARRADAPAARPARVTVRSTGQPVAGAEVTLKRDGALVASGRTTADGTLGIDLGPAPGTLTISDPA